MWRDGRSLFSSHQGRELSVELTDGFAIAALLILSLREIALTKGSKASVDCKWAIASSSEVLIHIPLKVLLR